MDNKAVELALGRIFKLGSRPFQEGDLEEYEACRRIILNEIDCGTAQVGWEANWARDRRKGAQGD